MIKTKEVIKELEHMNLQAEIRINNLFVVHSGREDIASVNLNTRFEINTNYWAFKNLLSEDEREKVYVLLTKLAETDPSEREEEKKYYLRHKWLNRSFDNYLSLDLKNSIYGIGGNGENLIFKSKFTQAEIGMIKQKFSTSLEDFEQIPVEEYE